MFYWKCYNHKKDELRKCKLTLSNDQKQLSTRGRQSNRHDDDAQVISSKCVIDKGPRLIDILDALR